MQCIRCLTDTAKQVAESPDGSGAWVVYYCDRCNFSWRNTEEPEVTDPSKRDPYFQLDKTDLDNLLLPVPIPPLKVVS